MIARLQQALFLALLLAAASWLLWVGPQQPARAVLGLLLLLGGHAVFLLFEFVLVCTVGRGDPTPRARLPALLRAWCRETLLVPRIFLWQQPFRAQRLPDQLRPAGDAAGRRGIVFIHGFLCNRGFWNDWLQQLAARGEPYVAVSLEPVFGSIDAYVPAVEDAVQRITTATGQLPLLICHSMGGLAARAWLRAHAADARVWRVVTLGTPHRGTWLARFSLTPNGRQMRPGSAWLRQLAQAETPQRRRLFVCYYSDCDNVVFPPSAATLPGADNRLQSGHAHVDLAMDAQVMTQVLARRDT